MKTSKKSTKRNSGLIKGEKVVLNTGNKLGSFEINRLDSLFPNQNAKFPDLEEIYEILLVAQSVLPDQFITSNQPERFNALHDRFNKYHGRKGFENANRDVKAWAV